MDGRENTFTSNMQTNYDNSNNKMKLDKMNNIDKKKK